MAMGRSSSSISRMLKTTMRLLSETLVGWFKNPEKVPSEAQIDQYQDLILAKQKEADSLKRETDILNAEIAKSKLEIKARTLNIQKLNSEIDQKSKNIDVLVSDIVDTKKTLAEFLRKVRQNDDFSILELALIYGNISQFFNELQSIDN